MDGRRASATSPAPTRYYNNVNVGDQADCNAHGIDYQPCVMPGDLSSGAARRTATSCGGSSTTWSALGAQGIYISMFDEFNEGNQIAKTAENAAMQPANFGLRALDEDGTACSSDYYLRITADGGRMLKGQIAADRDPADPAHCRTDAPAPAGHHIPAVSGEQPVSSAAGNAGSPR